MRTLLRIAGTGVAAAALHPLRSAVTIGCLVAILLPFVAGLGVSRGLRDQADDSIAFGADLYVAAKRLGRDAPVPLSVVDSIRALPGVTDVVPRIVGEVRLGTPPVSAVLVGLPADRLPPSTIGRARPALRGAGAPRTGRRLGTRAPTRARRRLEDPPFYRNDAGERVSTVVGVFRSDVPVWEANLVFTSFETASAIFAQQGLASSLLVFTTTRVEGRRAPRDRAPALARGGRRPRTAAPARDRRATISKPLVSRGLLHREGVFDLHLLLAFALAIPLVLVTTGVGLSERRRETGLLKATGWQTDEILVRSLAESLLLATAGASIAVLLGWLWLGPLGGVGIAGVFLSGADAAPGVTIPFRLTPVPALLTFLVSFLVVATGSAWSSWRAAAASPADVMR